MACESDTKQGKATSSVQKAASTTVKAKAVSPAKTETVKETVKPKKQSDWRESDGVRVLTAFMGTFTNGAFKKHKELDWRHVYVSSSAITGRGYNKGGLV